MYVTLGGQVVPRVYAPTAPAKPSMTTLCDAKQVRVNAFVSECGIHALPSSDDNAVAQMPGTEEEYVRWCGQRTSSLPVTAPPQERFEDRTFRSRHTSRSARQLRWCG
jgi:hypothetical protein